MALSPVVVAEALLSSYGLEFGPSHFLAAMRGVGLRSWQSAVGWMLTPLGKQTCLHLKNLGTSNHKQRNKLIFTRTNIASFKTRLGQPKALSDVPPPQQLKCSSPQAKHVPSEGENPASPFESSKADSFQLHHFREHK